jgi:hypothetical protein
LNKLSITICDLLTIIVIIEDKTIPTNIKNPDKSPDKIADIKK